MTSAEQRALHPEDDLLAAFAEQSLTATERAGIMEHLSACSRCRDIVFLAQRAAEPDAHALAAAPSQTTPGWRWNWGWWVGAGALATALVLASISLLHHSQKPVAQSAAMRPPASTPAEIAPPPAAPDQAPTSAARLAVPRRAAPPVPQPHPRVEVIQPPEVAAVAPPPAPPKVGMFSSAANPTPVANNNKAPSIKTGGFGDPAGLASNPNAKGAPNIAAVGAFDMPKGEGTGAGRAGKGSVQGVNMGAGVVGGVPGGTGHGKVVVGGMANGVVGGVPGGSGAGRAGVGTAVTGGFGSSVGATPPAPSGTASSNTPAPAAQSTAKLDFKLQPGKASTAVDVASAEPLLHTEDANISTSFSMEQLQGMPATLTLQHGSISRCVTTADCSTVQPSSKRIVSLASDSAMALAVDAGGALFLSHDQGAHWTKAPVQWEGKAVTVNIYPSPSLAPSVAKMAPPAGSGTVAKEKSAKPSVIELRNKKGQVWLSTDQGQTWRLRSE